ncbi:MAG TPA: TatD family hydrolase [Candidatus Paceibacterota bacterium]|nr:TatD family hydrolase [Candidatus Pacearchaeota archaeon]HRZ50920.1 TatD family hydrolase [Candidatus Paceibacterota bacterium]HSA36641.1 TatD family hydrolase [Candidatus Paceibacterota bacterium]
MEIIDTHAHLNFTAFAKDYKQVLEKCRSLGIAVINVGTNYPTSQKAVEMAETENNVYAAIGLHALNIGQSEPSADIGELKDCLERDFDYALYEKLGRSKKAVAIGEAGLDYYYKPKTKTKFEVFKNQQLGILKKQTDLACELDLPVIFHVRMAHEDLIEFLEKEKNSGKDIRGVIHCFTGTLNQAKAYLDLGLYIGLNGIIFKIDLNEVILNLPKDRIVFETDCPYLAPPGISGRNEPSNIEFVIERAARIRKEQAAEVKRYSTENAKKLFSIM